MKTLTTGERFFLYDSGSEDAKRFIIFATRASLELLQSCSMIAVDGTFDSCPLVFNQLWCIHGYINKSQIPLVYCFMSSRDTRAYKLVLSKLCEELPSIFKVRNIM